MCIACGACIEACPEKVVVPTYNKGRGTHEVAVVSPDRCTGCPAPCDAVCPSIDVRLSELLPDLSETPALPVDRRGVVHAIHLGRSSRNQFNGTSSSGGIIRALIDQELQNGSPVICLGATEGGYAPILATLPADTARIPGSIYHSVSFTGAIALLRKADRPVVLVATPCQLEGIVKYIRQVEHSLEDKVRLKVGLICGWMHSDHGLRAFATFKRLPLPVVNAAYRGEDAAGFLKFDSGGRRYVFNRRVFNSDRDQLDYDASFGAGVNRLRCRVCEDHVNVPADIAVGDAWLARHTGAKLSIIAIRSQAGDAALKAIVATGDVTLESASLADLEESQSANLVFGHTARKLNAFLSQRGYSTPSFDFGESDSAVRVTLPDRIAFRFELLLRWVLRREWYRAYRALYALRRAARWVPFLGRLRRLLQDRGA